MDYSEKTENTEDLQNTVKMGGGASNFKPWLFKKGQSGNPKGRPKGAKSLKTFAKEYLSSLSDEEKIEFMDGLPKDIVWRMAEGQPHQSTEMEHKGGVIVQFHDSFKKDATTPSKPTESNTE